MIGFIFLALLLAPLPASASYMNVGWERLASFEPWITAKPPTAVQKLDGKKVRIPGFMSPLSQSGKYVTEFLFIPTYASCMHVPPPTPNVTILVKASKELKIEAMGDLPLWLSGVLSISKQKKFKQGDAVYELIADKLEEYK